MHRIIRTKAYEAEHGPHFDEEHARKAVSKMENEDGSRGQHWSVEETSALANQYGIRFDSKFNKYDWYVALNMVYSDYYKVIVNMTGSNNSKYFVELAKAWICDKDIDEGKMWYYYIYVMCDKLRDANEYKAKKEAVARYDEEMTKCEAILKQLDYTEKEPEKEDPRIQELQDQVRELKDLIKQASNMVPPQMKQMLPQNMQKAMNEAS